MPRIPCEYYAKAQLTGCTLATTQARVHALGHPTPSLQYLQQLHTRMRRTRPTPFIVGSREAKAWFRDEKVYSLCYFEPDAQEAWNLTTDTTLRPVLEILLIANLTPTDVSRSIGQLSGQHIPEEVIQQYKHYFWNRDLLTLTEWETYLQEYPDGKNLWLAYLGEAEVALWKVGISPNLDPKSITDTLLGDSFMRMLELRAEPNTLDTAKKASLWASILFRAFEERRLGPQALREALEDMYQVSLRLGSMKRRDCRVLLDQNQKVTSLPGTVTNLVPRIKGKQNGD